MAHVVNPEVLFQVCQHISRSIIQSWNATDKHSQTLPDHFFKESHCIISVASSAQLFGADIKKMCVKHYSMHQDFLKVIPKAKLSSNSHDNMKQSSIIGMTEITLDAVVHQFKNATTPMIMWWLRGLSFSVNTVLSAQHRQVCDKIKTKLSTLGSVSS